MKNLILSSLVLFAPGLLFAADQPQWGQQYTRNLVSSETNLPDEIDLASGKGVKWVADLGNRAYSTPVIAQGRVLVGTNNEKPRDPRRMGDRGVLLCLDENDGAFLWQLTVPKRPDKLTDWPRTGICSSPVIDGDRVYLLSNRGQVLCLDLHGQQNGNDGPFKDEAQFLTPEGERPVELSARDADILWVFNVEDAGVHQHDAAHSSILVHGRFLYINSCNGVSNSHFEMPFPDAPALIVLDKSTGRWIAKDDEKMGRRTIHCTWSSPSVAKVDGRERIFFAGGDAKCYAFEPVTQAPPDGEVLTLKKVWMFDCDTDVPEGGVLKWQDNRKKGPSTIYSMPVFYQDHIYLSVGGDYWHGKPECWLKRIDARGQGDITETGEAWAYPLKRFCMSTPAVHDGLVYIGDCGKTFHCVDLQTGKAVWTERLGAEIWASPLVADGKVYIVTRKGVLHIFAAGREMQALAQVELKAPADASPVAANGTLYVTTMTRLYAFGH